MAAAYPAASWDELSAAVADVAALFAYPNAVLVAVAASCAAASALDCAVSAAVRAASAEAA